VVNPRLQSVERKYTVEVGGLQQQLTVYPKSKAVWIAFGIYAGQRIEAKGRTEGQALSNWRATALTTGHR